MRRSTRTATLRAVGLVLIVWALAAYLVLPVLWRHHEHNPRLADVPMVTRTSNGIPGDALNVALLGTREEVFRGMHAAGWRPADPITLRSSLGIAESVILDRPDPTAPVSSLYFDGRKQDLAFEQEIGASADQRHHVRFWQADALGDGTRPLWLGAATRDRGVGLSHTTGQITHHIAPDIDAERDGLISGLAGAGQLATTYDVSGIGPTLDGHNGGGDRYYTDGEMLVGVLAPDDRVPAGPPVRLPDPVAVTIKNQAWALGHGLWR